MRRNRVRSLEEQDALLAETGRSKAVRIGVAMTAIGGLVGMVGFGDYITDSNEYAGEMIVGAYATATVGLALAITSAIRVARIHDSPQTQNQIPQ